MGDRNPVVLSISSSMSMEEACLVSNLSWPSVGEKRQRAVHSPSCFHASGCVSTRLPHSGQAKPNEFHVQRHQRPPNALLHHLQPVRIPTCRTSLIVLIPRTKHLPDGATKIQSPVQKPCIERRPQSWDLSCQAENLCSHQLQELFEALITCRTGVRMRLRVAIGGYKINCNILF